MPADLTSKDWKLYHDVHIKLQTFKGVPDEENNQKR
jgi:hypothetical protein